MPLPIAPPVSKQPGPLAAFSFEARGQLGGMAEHFILGVDLGFQRSGYLQI